jgi:hypothetical protein
MFFKSLIYGKIPDRFKQTNKINIVNEWDIENPDPEKKYILIYDEPKVNNVGNQLLNKNNNKFSKNLYKIA